MIFEPADLVSIGKPYRTNKCVWAVGNTSVIFHPLRHQLRDTARPAYTQVTDCSLAGTNQRSLLPVPVIRQRRTMNSSSETMELYISSAQQGNNFTKGENIVYW